MEATPEKTRPNIVFLFPDQLRSDFLSCYGAEFIDTPNIDSIATAGTRYENSYNWIILLFLAVILGLIGHFFNLKAKQKN